MPTEDYNVRMIYIQTFAVMMLFKKLIVPIAYVGMFPPHAKLLKKVFTGNNKIFFLYRCPNTSILVMRTLYNVVQDLKCLARTIFLPRS